MRIDDDVFEDEDGTRIALDTDNFNPDGPAWSVNVEVFDKDHRVTFFFDTPDEVESFANRLKELIEDCRSRNR